MASLGKDLAHIRKEQELSLQDINEATKIPIRTLQSIEDDSIFDDFESNATYIRSYVRSYAKALSVDEKQIIYALNKVSKNDYSGSLQNYFTEKPKKSFEYDDEEEKTAAEDSDHSEDENEDIVHDQSPEVQPESPTPKSSEDSQRSSSIASTTPPDVKSVDWVGMGRKFKPLKSVGSKTWFGLSTILVLIIIVGAFIFFYEGNPTNSTTSNNGNANNQQETPPEAVSTDSLELNIVPSSEEKDTLNQQETASVQELPNENLSALPDTLTMVVYAAYGRLEPVRVYTDIMDDINPYWIEQGEAVRFNFVNDIDLRGQVNNMVLLMNGHPVQNIREEFYNPETRMLEINRTYFEGDSTWLGSAPDSLAIDAPPPSVIRERPTFN
ncbi:helix-turn-helix transcriptional regulator [Fodinibius sp. Rm-B-1B1-1]|uniref:helix-turn-helix domain-containing protein n=1 Tax=Fodinibius alkaliphilus TaxID=3140241 RepID=UPI00315B0847